MALTLCWDCARATGHCPWSEKFAPIKGWTAIPAAKTNTKPYGTYVVIDCPGFVRDAVGGGLKRYKETNNEKNKNNSILNRSAEHSTDNSNKRRI